MQIQHAAGGYNNLVNGTVYSITTASSGAPIITYTDSTTSNLFLSGSTGWNISSNSNSTTLCFNYNSSNKSYIDISGDLITTFNSSL